MGRRLREENKGRGTNRRMEGRKVKGREGIKDRERIGNGKKGRGREGKDT